ncbi:hypothetical protein ABQX22_08455 [Xanthomonas sp. WHRI 1810A]|uniref:hypothetical protein n=1 Tax=Xanthomonas sp. WHRI 1810A TaxID=3161565 RepID=UPI0032E8FD7A
MMSWLMRFLMLGYCLSTVLVPVFVLNKLFFLPLFLVSLVVMFMNPVKTIAPWIVLLVFLYGFILSLSGEADLGLGRQMLLGAFSLFLIYVISRYEIDMSVAVKVAGVTLALIMCSLSFMLMVMPGFVWGEFLLDYYNTHELGFYGVRNFGNLQLFMLHHRSSPFLLLPLALLFLDYLKAKKLLTLVFIGLILTAIICSASRALVAMAAVVLFILYFNHKSWPPRILILVATIPLAVIAIGYLLTETSVLSSDEQSNNIKLGHVVSFFKVADWNMLLFGKGLGSYFYTEGYGEVVSQTEITWMDSVRFVGVPFSLLLLGTLLFPVRKLFAAPDLRPTGIIMVLYLIMSMSNPVLFNSFGFLVILWYWSIIIKRQPEVALVHRPRGLI